MLNRPLRVIARNALRPANYRGLANMVRRYPALRENAGRYFRGTGTYPYVCSVRTPTGIVTPTLYSYHDMLTVNEVFCREDYRVGRDVRVVVDVGSNIGISALYFLSRNDSARCYLYEPVPRNVERLRRNLAGYEDRYVLDESAVSDVEGDLPFAVERFGRYGGLDVDTGETITVRCRHIDSVLEEILAQEEMVDVLKLDTEGAEARTVRAIRPDLLDRVATIYLEATTLDALGLDSFDRSLRCDTLRLANRPLRAGDRQAVR